MCSFKKIGIIAGKGKFPILLAQKAKEAGIDEVVVVGVKWLTSKRIKKVSDKLLLVKLGQLSELIYFLKDNDITQAVMAGKIPKISLYDKRVTADKQLQGLLNTVKDKKDDSLLKAVAEYLRQNGIELLDSTIFLKECLPGKGVLTVKEPTKEENEDIEFGKAIAKELAQLDIGQTIVVKDKAVLAVEAIEHTDSTIKRGGKLGNKDVVVIKVSRPNQDMRFDVPVVGLNTLKSLKKAGASVLAVESKKTLFIEKEKIIKKANKLNISIVAF